ncbi:HAD-IB family phosphatase [Shewanella algae]|uniref:HAD-IB family phosphatase n=1 Tax=Shewanella algae TaxID=38313 RepID=UPI001AAEDF89|nr:HAD-IB family phosphatase [Shewanella algae]MBO2590370.1 HAD-IB family phosphatase [Shewanella algae]
MHPDSGNIILFDFCETLVNIQTADRFIEYVLNRQNSKKIFIYRFYKSRFYTILYKIGLVRSAKLKILYLLKGMREEYLRLLAKEYADFLVAEHHNVGICQILNREYENGNEVVIISGGYDIYLNYYQPDKVKKVISSSLKFCDGVFSGGLCGLDCLGHNKVKLMVENFGSDIFDNRRVSFYTDHKSDIPLLDLVDEPYVVKTSRDCQWASEKGYKII